MAWRRMVVAMALGAWMLLGVAAAHAQSATTTTTAPVTVERSTSTANTGPSAYLYFVAAGGLVVIGAGARMRGRRAAGAHWA